MGNTKTKRLETHEEYITESYRNTEMSFTQKEMTYFKLSISDSEKYFHSKFDYFIYFNNAIFQYRLNILYDNFNRKIEKLALKGSISLLVNFDDNEIQYLYEGTKPEFDSLFTIIFERLEIGVLICFNMTNMHSSYIKEFFVQMIESIEIYKSNRRFDCFYLLSPNTDYIIKNSSCLYYISKNEFNKNYIEFFTLKDIESFLKCKYDKSPTNEFFVNFIKNEKPNCVHSLIYFDNELLPNDEHFNVIRDVINSCHNFFLYINLDYYTNLFYVLKYVFYEVIDFQECSEDNKGEYVRLTFFTKSASINLKDMIYRIRRYFALKRIKQRKYKIKIQLYKTINNDDEVVNIQKEYININYGGSDNTFNIIYNTFKNIKRFKKLCNQKIMILLSSFLKKNYKLEYNYKEYEIKHSEYLNNIFK